MEVNIELLKLSFGEITHARKLYNKSQTKDWKTFYTIGGVGLLVASLPIILIAIFLPGERTEIIRVLRGLFLFFSPIFLIGIVIGFILRIIVWVIFQIKSAKFPGQAIKFTPGDIEVSQSHIKTRVDWMLYREAIEDKKCFLLIKEKNYHLIIPKRVLSTEQQDTLRGLIKEHFPKFNNMS